MVCCRRCPVKQVQCKQASKAWKLLVAATEAWRRACSTASPLPLLPLCHLRHHLQSSGEDLPGWQAPVWPGRKRRTSSIATESKLHFIFSAPARCLVPTDPPLPSLAWSTPRCNFDAANSRPRISKPICTYLHLFAGRHGSLCPLLAQCEPQSDGKTKSWPTFWLHLSGSSPFNYWEVFKLRLKRFAEKDYPTGGADNGRQ